VSISASSVAQFVNTGEFRVLDRPAKLQFTWVSSRWAYQKTLVTVELYPREADCELVLTHERFPLQHSADQLAAGWTQILKKLGSRFGFAGSRQGSAQGTSTARKQTSFGEFRANSRLQGSDPRRPFVELRRWPQPLVRPGEGSSPTTLFHATYGESCMVTIRRRG
jgi:hypothetical protein